MGAAHTRRTDRVALLRTTIAALLSVALASCAAADDGDADAVKPWPADELTRRADVFLKRIVAADGLVDYRKAKSQKAELDGLVRQLASKRKLEKRADRVALHLNAYNLIVIQQIVTHAPRKSVREIKGFFKRIPHRVNGRTLTLNGLENKVIRPMGDPRIHAALVCAAVSCPPLRRGAYTPQKLDAQLDRITRRWVNDTTRNTARDGALHVSAIFKWYGKDFTDKPHKGVAAFLGRHAEAESAIAKLLRTNPSPPIEFLEYDWKLNQAPAEQKSKGGKQQDNEEE